MNQLAIVIPAYKRKFLHACLESFVAQTNQNFNLYIGDDASTESLHEIVDEFRDKLNLSYTKFENNLGSVSLIKQWERCISLTLNEPWIWLFSDDDIADNNCVNIFYQHLSQESISEFLKFSVFHIDKDGNMLTHKQENRTKIGTNQFIKENFTRKLSSYAIEYIFSRNLYQKNEKFVAFPLAWCSDDATWIKFSIANNYQITILNQAQVGWRMSGENISTKRSDSLDTIKDHAEVLFVQWFHKLCEKDANVQINTKYLIKWVLGQIKNNGKYYSYSNVKQYFIKREIILSPFQLYFKYLYLLRYFLKNKK